MFKNLKIKRKIIVWIASVFCGVVCSVATASASISVARAFYELARQNNTQKIESLLYRGYSLESVDENGYNPVCIAVSRQDRSSYNVLTLYGANKKPSCLKLVPESSYRRFFGSSPVSRKTITNKSDTPYLLTTALLGGGATAVAFALKGGSSGGSNNNSPDADYEKIANCKVQNRDICTLCEENYTLSKDGKKCTLSIKCPANSEYSNITKKCECKKGYEHFGNEEKCYATISGCSKQEEDKCITCDDTHVLYDGKCYNKVPDCKKYESGRCSECLDGFLLTKNQCIKDCPANTYYDTNKKECVCNSGFGKHGGTGDDTCYQNITDCSKQVRDTCSKCKSGYILSNNQCYKEIDYCEIQNADICEQCEDEYGIYGGDGTKCYRGIVNCANQKERECISCNPGYGTHGDPAKDMCYEDVDNCTNYKEGNYEFCTDCKNGFVATNGVCEIDLGCDKAKGLIQVGQECVCDERRGYTGSSDNCTRVEYDEDYVEGDGHYDVWSDLNSLHCNSHGTYNPTDGLCSCNEGYKGTSCAECADTYINFDGLCYPKIDCDIDKHRVQYYTSCICDEEYREIDGECIEIIECPKGMQQNKEGTCVCKPNFVQKEDGSCDCPEEIDGVKYEYEPTMDICKIAPKSCDEKNEDGKYEWMGDNCDLCPENYKITLNEEGKEECGTTCAEGYLKDDKGKCTKCAEGYLKDEFTGLCMYPGCDINEPGYIIENNVCVCDEKNNYYLGSNGKCQKKKHDIVGTISDKNNGKIELENTELRDVYGMKPTVVDENGNVKVDENGDKIYYDHVYNSINYNGAEINIDNKQSGPNKVYGIYANSNIYNAAAIGEKKALSNGQINIDDTISQAKIYGIYGEGEDHNIYNAFAYNTGVYEEDQEMLNTNLSEGTININKTDYGGIIKGGSITGIQGEGDIYNAYAHTSGEIAHSVAVGKIDIQSEVNGTVIGINGTSKHGRVNNAYAYLDGIMSNTIAEGEINVSGKSGVFGIKGNGIIVNSGTQFSKKFNVIPEFNSKGTINVTGNSSAEGEGAYGIYIGEIGGGNDIKNEIYNAMGYNAHGIINVNNLAGGVAYGIYSGIGTYILDTKVVYNNTYNAFRSSQIHGGENIVAKGEINVTVSGSGNALTPKAVGIEAKGDVFNSYVNSGSDVRLETEGIININDSSSANSSYLTGIIGAGGTIANAYAKGTENGVNNKDSTSKGTINITKTGGTRNSEIIGINATTGNTSNTNIYNAALINSQSSVEGKINITSEGSYSNIYGIKAEIGDEGVPKTVYNSFYDNTEKGNEKVEGEIKINAGKANATANIYGMYISQGVGYNSYTNIEDANVVGIIDITTKGGALNGEAVGMYAKGSDSAIYNNYKSKINITINAADSFRSNAYGMKISGGKAYNNGELTVKVQKNQANDVNFYGIYANNGSITNDEKGIITLENITDHGKSYGMYAHLSGDSNISVVNKGTITVNGINTNNYGIYAINETEEGSIGVINEGVINLNKGTGIYASGKNVTVYNTGTITGASVDIFKENGADTKENGADIVLENGAQLVNKANIESQSSIDLNSYGGEVLIAKGGSFKSNEDISGNLSVSSSSVMDNFDENITINDAIVAKDVSNLELLSKSYMYNALLRETSDGKHDIDVSLKDFKEITSEDKAKYYTLNYNKDNGELFNVLKKQETAQAYSKAEKEVFGEYVIPNITEEELRVSRSLDNVLISDLFKNNNEDIRVMAGADAVFIGRDDTAELTGYELDSESMYTLYDKKINNKYRLGLGLSFTHTNTDYNNDSSRKNFMVQGYVPVTYSLSDNIKLVSLAKLGYQDGEYTRYGADNDTYEADTSAITYGLANEIRYSINLGNITLSPFASLNATGWYNRGIKERGDSLALDIDSSYAFSLESTLGLYADMVTELDEKSKLTTTLGLAYYHEFANPYNAMNAKIINTLGSYKLRNHSADSRDRGILSAKINYDYKDFSIYGEILQYLEEEYPLKLDLGLRYKF